MHCFFILVCVTPSAHSAGSWSPNSVVPCFAEWPPENVTRSPHTACEASIFLDFADGHRFALSQMVMQRLKGKSELRFCPLADQRFCEQTLIHVLGAELTTLGVLAKLFFFA